MILIETKLAFGITTPEEKLEYEKCLIRAGHQLNKITNALRANTELLAEITGDSKVKFDELRIETMILSTSFIFDGEYFQGHRKLSLLEFMAILCNEVHLLALLSPKILNLAENSDESLEFAIKDLKKLNPYDSNSKPSIEDFIKALNSNIWERLKEYWG